MSQSGGYQYQSFVDSNSSLKPSLPTMVNGQPTNTTNQVQNGMQSLHCNLTGTPSSQSSRDPSRETSRDPSPTQYLHNQYRPQLPRPPMPPINGQQSSSVLPPPPRMAHTQQYSSTAHPYNIHNQFNSNPGSNTPVSNTSNIPTGFVPLSSNASLSQVPTSQSGISTNQLPQSTTSQNLTPENHSAGSVIPNSSVVDSVKSELHNPNQNYPWTSTTQTLPITPNTVTTVPSVSNNSDSTNQMCANIAPSSGQPPTNISSFHRINQHPLQTLPPIDQKKPVTSSAANIAQVQNLGQSVNQNSNRVTQDVTSPSTSQATTQHMPFFEPQNVNLTSPQHVPSHSVPKFGSQQNIFSNTQSIQSAAANMPTFVHNVNANTQSLFGNPQQSQLSTRSQSIPGPLNASGIQDFHAQQPKPQAQHILQSPMQPNLFGSHADSSGLGPISQQPQNIYGSQQNLGSQRKYPQNLYAGTMSPSTANTATLPAAPPKLNASPGSGQYPVKPTIGMPPLPGQQMQSQYDSRSQYMGQMSNVPLDSMQKRYPASYPDQMNQLNNQMSGMAVAQAGFNKLWGVVSVDLLQYRNVLPPERVEPPKIKLHQEFLDSVNCSPDIFRCTLTKIPESNSLLQKSRLPLGVLIHPFKDLNHLPVIHCSTIVRCRACRTYINPFVYFVDSKRWKCNLCYRVNELPEEFQFDPVTKSYGDPSRRPEVKTSTIEFIAPSEYMLRPPQPAVYLFILDVSRLAVESGYLAVVCSTIAEELSRLPGDARTQVGFLAIDSAIHFFSMPDNVSQPHEMIMLDVDDVFLPCPENLIVNLKEREELVRHLLDQLPTKFQGTHDTNSALGAGLQAAFKLMSPTGGRVTVFQTCLPNLGPGVLQAREDPNTRASKDVPHLNPATDFYKRLALDCSGQQIAVDLFLLNSQYSDLSTLSGMCKFSGGCIYHLPLFRASKVQSEETLKRLLRRYLTRKIGFEAVMRIRCTRGLSIHTFHGNFFVRSTDLLSLPNVNPDAGFGMQIAIEENLSDVQNVCFQAALLYTSSKGERRIRVHTLCLPVIANLSDVLHSADQQCIVGLLSKMAVDRSQQSSLSDARDALINVAIDVLSAYKVLQSVGSGGLLAPGNLKLLPLYIIALLKCVAFRSGTSTRLDDRIFAMCQLKTLPLSQLIQMVYPDLYPVDALDDRNSKDIDGKVCPQPPRLHLSAEKLDSRGAFLLDAGDKIFIYIGKNIHPMFCSNILGYSAFGAIPEELYELPDLDTIESERLRNFVFSLQEEKPYYASVQIIRDDSHFRNIFVERLIEDRFESALSYYEFLQHLKTQVK